MTDNARLETRERSDGHWVDGEARPIPTRANRCDGVSEAGEVCELRSADASPHGAEAMQPPQGAGAPAAVWIAAERRRLERDLHDGVQNELVALIVKLALARQDPRTPPGLAAELAGLEARAQAVLDSVRDIVRGTYPPLLAESGVAEALRAMMRASIHVTIFGAGPRSSDGAEQAVYFACSEAIQNAAKHAGPTAKVKLLLQHQHGTLAVGIADDGRGFDAVCTSTGAGLQNVRERIEAIGGIVEVASRPGRGTVLTISVPWPPAAGGRR